MKIPSSSMPRRTPPSIMVSTGPITWRSRNHDTQTPEARGAVHHRRAAPVRPETDEEELEEELDRSETEEEEDQGIIGSTCSGCRIWCKKKTRDYIVILIK